MGQSPDPTLPRPPSVRIGPSRRPHPPVQMSSPAPAPRLDDKDWPYLLPAGARSTVIAKQGSRPLLTVPLAPSHHHPIHRVNRKARSALLHLPITLGRTSHALAHSPRAGSVPQGCGRAAAQATVQPVPASVPRSLPVSLSSSYGRPPDDATTSTSASDHFSRHRRSQSEASAPDSHRCGIAA